MVVQDCELAGKCTAWSRDGRVEGAGEKAMEMLGYGIQAGSEPGNGTLREWGGPEN